MMEKTDLPAGSRIRKFLIEPLQLLGIEVVAVESEEVNIALLERIVLLAVHIEKFIEALIGIVMVPERSVKLDAGIEQGLVGDLELLLQVGWSFAPVDVVSQHDHKIKRKFLVKLQHPLRDLVLRSVSGSHISDDRKTNRAGLEGQRTVLRP